MASVEAPPPPLELEEVVWEAGRATASRVILLVVDVAYHVEVLDGEEHLGCVEVGGGEREAAGWHAVDERVEVAAGAKLHDDTGESCKAATEQPLPSCRVGAWRVGDRESEDAVAVAHVASPLLVPQPQLGHPPPPPLLQEPCLVAPTRGAGHPYRRTRRRPPYRFTDGVGISGSPQRGLQWPWNRRTATAPPRLEGSDDAADFSGMVCCRPIKNTRELIRTVNDAGVALGMPPSSQQESSILRNALQRCRSWRHVWDAGPTMPSNHLDGLSRGQVEEWLKRVYKRERRRKKERRRKRRSKWSSDAPQSLQGPSRPQHKIAHVSTGGTLPINLVLQGGRISAPAKMALSSQSSAPLQLALRAEPWTKQISAKENGAEPCHLSTRGPPNTGALFGRRPTGVAQRLSAGCHRQGIWLPLLCCVFSLRRWTSSNY
uniref:Uncharacterized protein n=1 Tax=Oryza rufipogon TaxID=4529 RepID=A0A0E0R3D9_ORYRU